MAIALGAIAIPFLAFGSLAAIGGEESILAGGAAIALVCIILLISVALLLLLHRYLEMSRRGTPFTGVDSARSLREHSNDRDGCRRNVHRRIANNGYICTFGG